MRLPQGYGIFRRSFGILAADLGGARPWGSGLNLSQACTGVRLGLSATRVARVHKIALKAQGLIAAMVLAGGGVAFAQMAGQQSNRELPKLEGVAPTQATDPQGNNALADSQSWKAAGSNPNRSWMSGGPLAGDDSVGIGPVAGSSPLDGSAPSTEGPLGGSLTDGTPLLGPGPLAGAAGSDVSSPVPDSGPLQGAAPSLAGGPAGVGGPTITSTPDSTLPSPPFIPVLQPPATATAPDLPPPPYNPPSNPTPPTPDPPPPDVPPTNPPQPPQPPCCIVPPVVPPPPPPPVNPPCQAYASGCT